MLWHTRRGVRVAYLYDVALAKPKRTPSPAQLVALGRAMTARRTCGTCGRDAGYVIPGHLGECLDCHEHHRAVVTRARPCAAA